MNYYKLDGEVYYFEDEQLTKAQEFIRLSKEVLSDSTLEDELDELKYSSKVANVISNGTVLSATEIEEHLNPVKSVETLEEEARWYRDTLLRESDWTQVPDNPISNKEEWINYRALLRDITEPDSFPYDIVWPDKPQS